MSRQFARFLLVGGLNTGFGYGIFALLTWWGLPYFSAIGLATLAGIAFNFQSTGRLVFGGALWTRIPRFVAVYALVCGLNIAGVSALLQADVNIYLANAVLILPLAVIGFMLQRRFVFAAP